MGLKQFNLDVAEAASTPVDGVSNIHRGDSDGEIVFTYTHHDLAPIELLALATDVDSYPRDCYFLVFTSSEHVEKHLVTLLESLSDKVTGKKVAEVIRLISTNLSAKLESNSTESSDDINMDIDGDDDDMSNGSGFDPIDSLSIDEEYGGYELDLDWPRAAPTHSPAPDRESLRQFKHHLRQASGQGIFVSLSSMKMVDSVSGILSMAVHVSKLGISDEVLEAWDLKCSDFVVMLVKLPYGYRTTQKILELPSDQSEIRFRFGKCASPRPSPRTANGAFNRRQAGEKVDDMEESSETEPDSVDEDAFVSLYISGSLNSLLNQEFLSLLHLRRSQDLSWDQAQQRKFNMRRAVHIRTRYPQRDLSDEATDNTEDIWENPINLEGLQHDYALDDEKDLNILLVAMQFALQRLVRCTKYCMVCHQRTKSAFEAVTPFVCDSSLCLYQYLALGFGQGIEYEIINNPYVVDLLIDFFVSAITAGRVRELPVGLNLRSCVTGNFQRPDKHLKVNACFQTKMIRFDVCDFPSHQSIKEGQLVSLMVRHLAHIDPPSPGAIPLASTGPITGFPNHTTTARDAPVTEGRNHIFERFETHICMVESVQHSTCNFRIVSTKTGPAWLQGNGQSQATHPEDGWQEVLLFKHDRDIDDLSDPERNSALQHLSCIIPPVLEMREYLMEKPGRLLSSWKGFLDTSTLTLLNWIVASNRSLIVQDGPVPADAPVPDASGTLTKDARVHAQNGNRVIGMDEEWMQFRFAQGAPEKEQIFTDELEKCRRVGVEEKKCPSLFLWHGSPLSNWHSIIRSGLDFKSHLHGRAYGDGVYFSPSLHTSLNYSGVILPKGDERWKHSYHQGWQNSVLQATNAISICEVINEPSKFVSTTPHCVVNQVEWIQCRYLFVRVNPKYSARAQPFPKPSTQPSKGYIAQDPVRQLLGPKGNPLKIPLTAIPVRRRLVEKSSSEPDTLTVVDRSQMNTWEGIIDDVGNLSDSEDEDRDNSMARKRRRPSADSGMEVALSPKLTTAMQEARHNKNVSNPLVPMELDMAGFQPGALNHDNLPKLMEPTWASSSPGALRSLNREIKDLQRIQAKTNIRTLGWYINFDKLSNIFSWIVELHSFDESLPLAKDMKRVDVSSVVLECRFGATFPMSPPFVRVIRPRFLPFSRGGGGHVTAGGSICSELLTNSGWSPALTLEKVFLEVRMSLCDKDPPARLDTTQYMGVTDYGPGEAEQAYRRAVASHGWQLPADMSALTWS
ncbi:hypothetical protein B0T10DRAFT_167910 [Thelonectria olida]|uniref:UBC core domain-containing protein n=1 Tax=Thelonectria olida TaxID=1576542 RepID=A0A9P8WG75_9HYPO|nr:hypothetical protein B0T10DRAFT_167910 [Thelonectria olida]